MYRQRGFGFSFALTPVVKRLLIANVAVFIVTFVIGPELINDWFAFQPRRVLTRFWGAFTYMFVHADLWHLAMNMLVLFFFGPPLESRWGGREFFRFYVIAGLGGVALSFILVPVSVIGASAACFGLMLAFGMAWPNAPIYVWGIFPVKAKWLVGFLFAVVLMSAVGNAGGGVAHWAHLGGFATAFLYLKFDWKTSRLLGPLASSARRTPRPLAIVPRKLDIKREESARTESGPPRGDGGDERRLLDQVDRVLDKISAEGMSSLSESEKKLLDEVSRRRRLN